MPKENVKEVTDVFWVARTSNGKYAVQGQGQVIDHTKDIWKAKRFYSMMAIPGWMGGHYRGYTAVRCHIRKTLTELEEEKWPSKGEVEDAVGWDP